uniref:Uncharacterized protein n=1 Tax=Opuntia streptacantha TaxID=393608 RepID=A0A7C9A0K1_OPUST
MELGKKEKRVLIPYSLSLLNKIKVCFKGYKETLGDCMRAHATTCPFSSGEAGHVHERVEAEVVTSLFLGESDFISLRNGLRLPRFSSPFIIVFLIIRLPLIFSFSFL